MVNFAGAGQLRPEKKFQIFEKKKCFTNYSASGNEENMKFSQIQLFQLEVSKLIC